MGGAVSSGRDNDELIDNLMGGNYIRTRCVERVFRALDRAEYMTPEARDQAYKDLAWRSGPLHMSAPCIYSEVMEGLELKPGLSFLNVGSGTGYLSTLVGLVLGSSGISHGVEIHPTVVEYANKKLSQFMENSPSIDEFDFCEPRFYLGNGLCLAPLQTPYDRVYCGAGCPEQYENYFKQLIKVGGVLVMPLNDNLVQVRRVSDTEWTARTLLNVSFASLREPTKEEAADLIRLEEQTPARLQALARAVIRASMRRGLVRRHPELREPPPRPPPAKKACPRRICIPIEDESDVEGLNALHDLDRASGAHEMNALLSLVLSMGQNRVAGALRFDTGDTSSVSSSDDDGDTPAGGADDDDDDDDGDDDDDADEQPHEDPPPDSASDDTHENPQERRCSERISKRYRNGVLCAFALDTPNGTTENTTESTDKAENNLSTTSTEQKESTSDTAKRLNENSTDKSEDDKTKQPEDPSVPAEVEIYLGKTNGVAPGTSREGDMEWEEGGTETVLEASSDEETTEGCSAGQGQKRQKLDSGIGENSPSSGSSPGDGGAKSESDGECSHHSESLTDDIDDVKVTCRKRLRKRGRTQGGGARRSSSADRSDRSNGSDRSDRPDRSGSPGRPCHCKRPARNGNDARRVRLSIVMKRGVKELPLPYALKKYVNLGRCFQF